MNRYKTSVGHSSHEDPETLLLDRIWVKALKLANFGNIFGIEIS